MKAQMTYNGKTVEIEVADERRVNRMTELERKALLGDREAQQECTEKGIVLPCPCCGCGAKLYTSYDGMYIVQCVNCGCGTLHKHDSKSVIRDWNTRKPSQIGRCGECAHWYKKHCAHGTCATEPTDADFFCGNFEPKGGEENEVD